MSEDEGQQGGPVGGLLQRGEELVEVIGAVEGVDRITQQVPVAVAIDGDLDAVRLEKVAFQLLGIRGLDRDREHLAEEIFADGAYRFGAKEVTEAEGVVTNETAAGGGHVGPLMFPHKFDRARDGQEGGEIAGPLSLVIIQELRV